MSGLWLSDSREAWRRALDSYEAAIARAGRKRLPELDRWYRSDLPAAIKAREPKFVTLEELARLTEWKMTRGVWRARNLALVRSNAASDVEEVSAEAFAKAPHPSAPVAQLATLAGVGPATASAVMAAYAPQVYPFLDDVVGARIPGLGPAAFTLRYYAKYASALRERAARLGGDWTPVLVERALWADSGSEP